MVDRSWLFFAFPMIQTAVLFGGLSLAAAHFIGRSPTEDLANLRSEVTYLELIFVNVLFIHLQTTVTLLSFGAGGGLNWSYMTIVVAVIVLIVPYYLIRGESLPGRGAAPKSAHRAGRGIAGHERILWNSYRVRNSAPYPHIAESREKEAYRLFWGMARPLTLRPKTIIFLMLRPSGKWASVAQSVEQLIRNQRVGGSIPLAGSRFPPSNSCFPQSTINRCSCQSGRWYLIIPVAWQGNGTGYAEI